jgi:hypothetical protein
MQFFSRMLKFVLFVFCADFKTDETAAAAPLAAHYFD